MISMSNECFALQVVSTNSGFKSLFKISFHSIDVTVYVSLRKGRTVDHGFTVHDFLPLYWRLYGVRRCCCFLYFIQMNERPNEGRKEGSIEKGIKPRMAASFVVRGRRGNKLIHSQFSG